MRLWRQFVLLGFAASAIHAHTSVVHLPKAPSHVEWTVQGGLSNDWEVTVTLDAAHCDIYCEIRRKPDSFGRIPAMDLLLPPSVAVRIFSDAVSQPITTIIDPAGRTTPAARRQARECDAEAWGPGKKALAVSLRAQSEPNDIPALAALRLFAWCDSRHAVTRLPLRI